MPCFCPYHSSLSFCLYGSLGFCLLSLWTSFFADVLKKISLCLCFSYLSFLSYMSCVSLCSGSSWVFFPWFLCFWSGSHSSVSSLSISAHLSLGLCLFLSPGLSLPFPQGPAFLAFGFIPPVPLPEQRLRAMGSVLRA